MYSDRFGLFTIEGTTPPYMLILNDAVDCFINKSEHVNSTLNSAEDSSDKFHYRKEVLLAAGWNTDIDGRFIDYPTKANIVLQRIERALKQTHDPKKLLDLLEKNQPLSSNTISYKS